MSLAPIALAIALAAVPASAQSGVKDLFEKHRLLGVFAVDCGKPADKSNIYQVIRLIDANAAQVDDMSGATTRDRTIFVDKAEAAGPNAIRIIGTLEDLPLEALWQVEPQRQRLTEIKTDGVVIVRDGVYLGTPRSTVYFQPCKPQASETNSAFAKSADRMPKEAPTYQGRVEDWIGGNLLFVQSPTGGVKKVDLSLHGIVGKEGSAKEAQEVRARLEAFAKGRVIKCWLRQEDSMSKNMCFLDGADIALWALEQKLVKASKNGPPEYLAVPQ